MPSEWKNWQRADFPVPASPAWGQKRSRGAVEGGRIRHGRALCHFDAERKRVPRARGGRTMRSEIEHGQTKTMVCCKALGGGCTAEHSGAAAAGLVLHSPLERRAGDSTREEAEGRGKAAQR